MSQPRGYHYKGTRRVRCAHCGQPTQLRPSALAARLCLRCRPVTVQPCAVCGTPFEATAGVVRYTCSLKCKHRRQWQTRSGREAAALAQSPREAWVAPVVAEPVEPPPDPPRPVVLPDGTEAIVVWAGDMRTGAGVRGGLLDDRRSTPYDLDRLASALGEVAERRVVRDTRTKDEKLTAARRKAWKTRKAGAAA